MAKKKTLPQRKPSASLKRAKKKSAVTNEEVVEMLQFIIERMVTKEELNEGLDNLRSDLVREIRQVDQASKERDRELAEKIDGIYDELDGIKSRTKRLEDVVFR